MNEFHLADDDLKDHVKAVFLLHFLLHRAPVQAVGRFKDPGFCAVAQKHQDRPFFVLVKVVLATLFTFVLPSIYGFTIMENPCAPEELLFKEGGFNAEEIYNATSFTNPNHWKFDYQVEFQNTREVGLAGKGCDAQAFMRSWKALLITPTMTVFLLILYQGLRIISRSTHAKFECWLKKTMRSEVEALCYGANDIPAVYNAVLLGYVGMFIAFAAVAVLLGDVTALVVAYALATLFLRATTGLLGASQALRERYDAEVSSWTGDLNSDVVQRLFQKPGPLVWVTQEELRAICRPSEDVRALGWPSLLDCIRRDELPISNDSFKILRHGHGKTLLVPCGRTRPFASVRKRFLLQSIYVADRNLTCKLDKNEGIVIDRDDIRKDGESLLFEQEKVGEESEKKLLGNA